MSKYVTAEWSTAGYFGRARCVCCNFDMLGENRILTLKHKRTGQILSTVCDGCADAIAEVSDGRIVRLDGVEMK